MGVVGGGSGSLIVCWRGFYFLAWRVHIRELSRDIISSLLGTTGGNSGTQFNGIIVAEAGSTLVTCDRRLRAYGFCYLFAG